MIALRFAGYFQCRLATDPDPSDEPRGVSGFHWAVAGEDDFDRIIRFHDPKNPRLAKPEVGVYVTEVVVDGRKQDAHPLLCAPFDLIGEPRYEGRNGIIAQSGTEPIVPFTIHIRRGELLIRRDSGETTPPYRKLASSAQVYGSPGVIGFATGVWDFGKVLSDRRQALVDKHAELEKAPPTEANETACAAIQSRLDGMDAITAEFATMMYGFRLLYMFRLTGPAACEGQDVLNAPIDEQAPWHIEFWMGAWDIDALCGYIDGWLILPQHQTTAPATVQALTKYEPGPVHPLEFFDAPGGR